MSTDIQSAAPVSKKMIWAGRIVSALPVLMLLLSATMKFFPPSDVLEQSLKMGFNERVVLTLGVVELVCTILYVVPQTAVLGAILLTGYLGGAVATHVRMGDAFLIPVLFGVLVWLGLFLRDPRIRALIPLRL